MPLAEIFKALADDNRIRILNLLMKAQLCVCELETLLDMTQTNVSRHLNKLKSAGVITSEKNAQWVYYGLSQQFVAENAQLYEYLKEVLSRDSQCLNDVEKLEKYKISGYFCQHLKTNRDEVIKYISSDKK